MQDNELSSTTNKHTKKTIKRAIIKQTQTNISVFNLFENVSCLSVTLEYSFLKHKYTRNWTEPTKSKILNRMPTDANVTE